MCSGHRRFAQKLWEGKRPERLEPRRSIRGDVLIANITYYESRALWESSWQKNHIATYNRTHSTFVSFVIQQRHPSIATNSLRVPGSWCPIMLRNKDNLNADPGEWGISCHHFNLIWQYIGPRYFYYRFGINFVIFLRLGAPEF